MSSIESIFCLQEKPQTSAPVDMEGDSEEPDILFQYFHPKVVAALSETDKKTVRNQLDNRKFLLERGKYWFCTVCNVCFECANYF